MTSHQITATENSIARRLINSAIAAGYCITVRDGIEGDGEFTLRLSTDAKAIMAALRTTDGDKLYVRTSYAPHRLIGTVTLIWGNSEDLVSDYSDNADIQALVDASALPAALRVC